MAVSDVRADLVCEGGGVRGSDWWERWTRSTRPGTGFPRRGKQRGRDRRLLVAALQVAGEPISRLADIMRSIDYRKFLDRNLIGRVPLIGGALSLLTSDGVYRGLPRAAARRAAR